MSELTDDELNERIYEAQGYEKLGFPAVPTWQKPSGDGLPRGLYHEPKYATDLNAAFELVREAEAKGWWFLLASHSITPNEKYDARLAFGNKQWVDATAATPARAIAEAWLAWREAKQQQEQGG